MPCPSMGTKGFWTVQIVLEGYKLFWSGANCFGRIQIILARFKLDFSGIIFIIFTYPKLFGYLSKTTWTRPIRIGPIQNDWYSTKIIWTVQNHFGPIEGQTISYVSNRFGSGLIYFGLVQTRFLCKTKICLDWVEVRFL